MYVQAEMSLKGSWFTVVCWYIISCSSLIMRFFSVVKLFTQDFVFVWKILLACGFNASGHTQVENVFRIQAGFATIIPIFVWSDHADLITEVYGRIMPIWSQFMVGSCRFWSQRRYSNAWWCAVRRGALCARAHDKQKRRARARSISPATWHNTAPR